MKPTVQNPDFYAVGNDYAQAPISAFFDADELWTSGSLLEAAGYEATDVSAWENISGNVAILIDTPKNYQDGIYTQLADTLSGWKDPEGFNKRTLLVNPSAKYSDADYGQADVIYDNIKPDELDEKKLNPALLDKDLKA
jgi:hypothetical protein